MIKQVLRYTIGLWVMLFGSTLFAAPFSSVDSLVNVPKSHTFYAGELQVGSSASYYKKTDGFPSQYELDYYINYSFSRELQFGVRMMSTEYIVGQFQYYLGDVWGIPKLSLGIDNLSNGNVSTFNNHKMTRTVSNSLYVVSNISPVPDWGLYLGYGLNRFQYNSQHDVMALRSLQAVNGLFFGATYDIEMARLMVEYDGVDINVGAKVPLHPKVDLNIALTELFRDDDMNSYFNAPVRTVAIGIEVHSLFGGGGRSGISASSSSESQELLSDWNQLSDELNDTLGASSSEAYDGNALYHSRLDLAASSSTEAKVGELYANSLDHYARGNFQAAVQDLLTALHIAPQSPNLYLRLGTLYYERGDMRKTLEFWQTALQLQPYNMELQMAIEELKHWLN